MTDMTPAERAAAEAIRAAYARNGWRMPDDFEDEARAVVAAVRGPLFSDAKERLSLARELASGSAFTAAEAMDAVECVLNAYDKRRIQAALLVEAAESLRNSERLRNFTDDHMGDVNETADELDRMAAALLQPEVST